MAAPAQTTACPALRVLLIEDSARLGAMLSDMLNELEQVEVIAIATREEQALGVLQENTVDVAIIDLELQQGSGLGVLRALRNQPGIYGLPETLVFSNYGHDVLRLRCAALGVRHFFDKSFQLDDLLDHVQALAQYHNTNPTR